MKPIEFPIMELISEGYGNFCPECGSTAKRRFILFGKKFCINPDCRWREK